MTQKIVLLFFVFATSFISLNAQIIKEHFNKKLIYNEGQDELKFDTTTFSLVINEGEMMLAKTAEFHFLMNKENFRISGNLYDDKYFSYNGHTVFSVSSDWKKFKKVENESFTFDQFENLTKYISEDKGMVLSVFTLNLNDGIDYSKAINFLTTKYGYNTPYLEKGEILVYADYTFKNGQTLLLNVLQSIEDISQDFYYNKQDIEYALSHDHVKPGPPKLEPKYCGRFQEGVELPKVDEYVSDFRVTLCEYYDYWGYNNNKELQQYYHKELERMVALIKERSLLTDKEITEFRKKIEADKDENFEKNFIVKKPYP